MTRAPLTPPPPDREAAAAAAARFARTAPADVRFAELDTPLGRLLAATTDTGLVAISYEDGEGGREQILDRLAARLSPRILERRADLDPLARELEQYFAGARHAFDLPLDWSLARGTFARRVLRAARRIPYGAVDTYAHLAAAAGNPRGSRAAGNALGANPLPIIVPCHRVVRTGGGLGGYTGGLDRKRRLLAIERGEPALAG